MSNIPVLTLSENRGQGVVQMNLVLSNADLTTMVEEGFIGWRVISTGGYGITLEPLRKSEVFLDHPHS